MMSGHASWLAALDARIEREIRRLRVRYELSLDEFRGLYVSDEQVDRLIAGASTSEPPALTVLDRPGSLLAGAVRWQHLADAFDLPALEQDLLLIAAAPEIDLKYETLYAYLNNDVARKWPSADLAHRLLSDVASVETIAAALAAGGRLHARHLIQRIEAPQGRPALMNAGYALDPCVTYWVHDQEPLLAFDRGAIAWAVGEALAFDAAARRRAAPLARVLERASAEGRALPVVALLGQPGSGRTAAAAALAAMTGRPLVRIDLRALPESDADGSSILDRLHVALSLSPAIVLLETADVSGDDDARRQRAMGRVARAIAGWPSSAFVLIRTNDDEGWRSLAALTRAIEVRCDLGTYAARVEAWRDAAAAESILLPDASLHALAGRFELTPGHVRATLATASDLAAMAGTAPEASSDEIAAAARLSSDQALGRLAVKVERKHQWNDLVLPSTTLRRLRELTAAIRHRHVVYGEWGFGDRVLTGTGIKALFAGGSGTGKTMAAGVIARELELDLYKIDLSGIVSKYIGETEKNLDRIFRAARTANAIVLLDEAEAIMGKRSEVKDAHDRYANIEVAYLLQRLEDHDGIVILATNLKRNIDDAFNRRMQYVVDFPRPEEPEREQIWRRMFPSRSPVAADVDFSFLARQFDLAGGDIRNVVLDAAFLAAEDGGVIDMRAIVEALARQLAKLGKTPTGTDFRQYQRLLTAAGGRHDAR